MSDHTFVSNRLHCIFSTKDRRPLIAKEIQPRLWSYLGGIARNLQIKTYAMGGTEDHVHLFLGLPATITTAKAIQTLKANSSRWLREELALKSFAWQEGYGAFSVSLSHTDATIAYIQNQAQQHKKRGYDEEFAEILRKHRMAES